MKPGACTRKQIMAAWSKRSKSMCLAFSVGLSGFTTFCHFTKAASSSMLAKEVKTTNFQIAKKIGAKGTRSTTLSRLHSEALS